MSKRLVASYGNTDNNVANYKVYQVTCDYCGGSGKEYATIVDLMDYLHRFKRLKGIVKECLSIYRYWKETDFIPCRSCEGAGIWEEER